MVAVDGTEESERAVEWSIRNLCRSGDLLHICHVSTAGDVDPRSAAYYSGPPDPRSVVDAEIGHTVDFFPAPAMSPRRRRAYDETWAPKYLHRARVGRALVFVAAFLFLFSRRRALRHTSLDFFALNVRTNVSLPPRDPRRTWCI